MTWVNIFALILLGLECISMHLAVQAVWFPLVVFLVGIFCVSFNRRFHLNHTCALGISAFVIGLGIIRFIILTKNTLPTDVPEYANVFGSYNNAYLVAQVFFVLQLVNLSVGITDLSAAKTIYAKLGGAATYFFLAVGGQACIMDRILDKEPQTYVHLLALPFASVCGLYILACAPANKSMRNARFSLTYWVATSVLLGISGFLAYYISASLDRNQTKLDTMFYSAFGGMRQSLLGFSRDATLGNLALAKQMDANAVALRVIADDAPGYMRGIIFDRYERNTWRNTLKKADLFPLTAIPAGTKRVEGESLFELYQTVEPPSIVQEVWPDSASLGILFAPLETAWIGVNSDILRTDPAKMVEITTSAIPQSHHNYLSSKRTVPPISDTLRRSLLVLPPNLKPEIYELSQKITAGCVSNAQKASAVSRYFTSQYQYSLHINIPPQNEPLTYFLLNKPAAHCEYFASGAAILLRIAGVPCRYVNGFVVVQHSSFSDYWIANNHDAHAWVEAYDESIGWFVVEATPGDGVPAADDALDFKEFWNAFTFRGPGFQQWMVQLRALLHVSNVVWITLSLFIAALIAWSLSRGLPWKKKVYTPTPEPFATVMNSLLAIMDRRVKAKGYIRVSHETLNHFSKRLLAAETFSKATEKQNLQTISELTWFREAADWYYRYAKVRYGTVDGETAIAQLQETMPSLKD